MLAIWSLVPLPFLKPAWTSGISWVTYCLSLAWRIWAWLYQHMRWVQLCGSLSILWHCLSLGLEWKLTFSSPVATAEFSKFAGILSAAVGSHVRHYWQNGGTAPNPLSFSRRNGPGMKELGLVILTCSFLSSVELAGKNVKVLERSMRKHKAFYSCA